MVIKVKLFGERRWEQVTSFPFCYKITIKEKNAFIKEKAKHNSTL